MNHATTSFAFASHKQGQFTGFSHATTSSSPANFHDATQGQGFWNQDPYQQQHNKKWHHHGDSPTNNIKNIQNADCTSSSTASGGDANGGSGGTGNGGNGGTSPGGSGGDSNGGNGGLAMVVTVALPGGSWRSQQWW